MVTVVPCGILLCFFESETTVTLVALFTVYPIGRFFCLDLNGHVWSRVINCQLVEVLRQRREYSTQIDGSYQSFRENLSILLTVGERTVLA